MARLDTQLVGVFLWFTSVKKFLKEKYPFVYGDESDGIPISGAEILLSLQSSLNGGDITKNNSIKAAEIHEALNELNLAIKNSQKDV